MIATDLLEPKRAVASISPHPLLPAKDRALEYAVFLPNETISAYLKRTGLAERMGRQPFMLTINDRKLPRALWARCKPKPGSLIHLYATVHSQDGQEGDGADKNPLMIAAYIALIYFSGGVGAAYGTFAGAAVMVVGGMAISKMFPPPKPRLPGRDGLNAVDTTYSLAGGSNSIRPNEPFSKIIGTHRVFPDFGARPFTEFRGSDQYSFYVFDLGYNDVDLSDFKIGGNPISSYEGVTLEQSGADGKLTLFPGNVDSTEGASLTFASSWVTRTSSPDVTALAVELQGSLFFVEKTGNMLPAGVTIEVQYRAVGAVSWIPIAFPSDDVVQWVQDGFLMQSPTFLPTVDPADLYAAFPGLQLFAGQTRIINANRSLVQRSFYFQVPKGQYEVRVKRVDPEITTTTGSTSEFVWTQLRSYQIDNTAYDGRKRVALMIKATGQLNGTLQQFSCIARAKTQVWNGAAWVQAQTSNPAWWYLDALRGKFAGTLRVWGGGIADSRNDLENIKAFGAWCDAQGLTINCVFSQQTSVMDVLNAIALMGRGTPSLGTAKHGVVWDAPNLPVTGVFGMHNIVAGSFEIAYTNDQLADVIEATFVNPDLDWQQDIVRATVPGATGVARVKRIDLFGRTNKTLAGQDANLYAAANALRTRRYKWHSDWEAMPCSRGDVAELSHDLASLDHSGRFIEGGSATTLKLAKTVPLFTGGAFIVLVKPDGTFATYPVAGGVGSSDTLTATPPLPFNPWVDVDNVVYDYKWLYGPTATPGRRVKIDGFRPLSERLVELTAIDDDPTYYASKDNLFESTAPRPSFGAAPNLSNLQMIEDGLRAGTGYITKVSISWDASGNYSFADVRASFNGGPFTSIETGFRERTLFLTMQDGTDLVIEVTGYGDLGRLGQSAKLVASKHIDFSALKPPSQVGSFSINGRTMDWPTSPEVDVVGYKIFFQYGDHRVRSGAAPLHSGLVTASPKNFDTLPSGQVSIGIVAVDAAGLESIETSWIVTDLGDPFVANVVEEIDFKALGFPGMFSGGTISVGNLVANTETLFYAADDAVPVYTSDSAVFYTVPTYSLMTYETEQFSASAIFTGSQMTLAVTLEGLPAMIEFRAVDTGPFYSSSNMDLVYTADADPFYEAQPSPYVTWPGSYTISPGLFQFRITTARSSVQGKITQLKAIIDAPDMEEFFNDFHVGIGGTRLPITKPFTAIKNIQVTLQSDGGTAEGARWVDKQISPTGPLIATYNAANSAVAGIVDARVKGY
jgi:hypothetical protein